MPEIDKPAEDQGQGTAGQQGQRVQQPTGQGQPHGDLGSQAPGGSNAVASRPETTASGASATSGGGGGSEALGKTISVQGGDALTGAGGGSDTRAGSLEGGSAAGSETQSDDAALSVGGESRSFQTEGGSGDGGQGGMIGEAEPGPAVVNTGEEPRKAERAPGDDVDAATG